MGEVSELPTAYSFPRTHETIRKDGGTLTEADWVRSESPSL